MRRATFICRPCLALIRRQQPAPARGPAPLAFATTARRRNGEGVSYKTEELADATHQTRPPQLEKTIEDPLGKQTTTLDDAAEDLLQDEYDEIYAALVATSRKPRAQNRRTNVSIPKPKPENKPTSAEKWDKPISSQLKVRKRQRWKDWQNRYKGALTKIRQAKKENKPLDTCLTSKKRLMKLYKTLKELLDCDDVDAMRKQWFRTVPVAQRWGFWPKIMAAALDHAPTRAHEVLEATYEYQVSSRHTIGDTLYFLSREVYSGLPQKQRRAYRTKLGHLVLYLLRSTPKGYLEIPQSTMFTLTQIRDAQLVAELYRKLREYGQNVSGFTKLHVVSSLALAGDPKLKDMALDVLEDLIRVDMTPDLDSPPVAAAATTIVTGAKEEMLASSLTQTAYNIIMRLSDIGLRLNMYTCTAIIQVFCLNGEMEKAWKVYDYVASQGNVADNILLSTLLHGAKRQGDFNSFSRVLHKMSESRVTPDPILCNDIMHAIHWFFVKENEEDPHKTYGALPTFSVVLQVYAKLFKLGPLQSLLPMHNLAEAIQSTPELPSSLGKNQWQDRIQSLLSTLDTIAPPEPLDPGDDTLSIALSIYVRSLSNPLQIVTFYAHFRNLIQSDNEAVLGIINQRRTLAGSEVNLGSLIHDAVIHSLNAFPGMLRASCDVMRDMETRDDNGVSENGQAKNRHPAPSVYTYNHLLHSLVRGLQFSEAEAILDMMRTQGIMPNSVTWNIMIKGYARSQNARKTMQTLQRMEEAGFAPDEATARALGRLRNRGELMDLLEERARKREKAQPGIVEHASEAARAHEPEEEPASDVNTDELLQGEEAFLAMERELAERTHSERRNQSGASSENPSPKGLAPKNPSLEAEDAFLDMERELAEKAHSERLKKSGASSKTLSVTGLARELVRKKAELAAKEMEISQLEQDLVLKGMESKAAHTKPKPRGQD